MRVYLNTIRGTQKPFSEDRVLVGHDIFLDDCTFCNIEIGNVAVADGVGGNRGGAIAAYQVCKMLSCFDTPQKADFLSINDSIIEQGLSDDRWRNMATTLTGICFSAPDSVYAFHVGNTRLYAIQAGMYLKQITDDDTVVNYLVHTGKLTEEEAINYPKRNEITACFGGNSKSLMQIKMLELDTSKQSQYLITSDGIHEALSIDDLEDIVAEDRGDWAVVVERLVSEAKAKGSTDDCTAVIIDCTAEEDSDGAKIS